MATIHVEKEIQADPAEILRKLETNVLSLPNFKMFVDRYQITESAISFEGSKGINGRVEVMPGRLIVDVTLGAMASLMKPLIESRLRELLDRLS